MGTAIESATDIAILGIGAGIAISALDAARRPRRKRKKMRLPFF